MPTYDDQGNSLPTQDEVNDYLDVLMVVRSPNVLRAIYGDTISQKMSRDAISMVAERFALAHHQAQAYFLIWFTS